MTSATERPRVVPVVDVAVTRTVNGVCQVLLGKRDAEGGKHRFPGGHVDDSDETAEAAAEREVQEEAGLDVCVVAYVGSYRVENARARPGCSYITAFYRAEQNDDDAIAVPGDDIDAVIWVPLDKLSTLEFADSHAMLAAELVRHLGGRA